MSNNQNTANGVENQAAESETIQSPAELRALAASGSFSPLIAAGLLDLARKMEQKTADVATDEWGNVKVGPSTLTIPAILAVLEAEASDRPLSVRLASHLEGFTDSVASCTDLRNNPPRRTVVGKNGEAIGTPISMRSSSFQYRGVTLGGSLKAADANAVRIKAMAERHAVKAESDAAKFDKQADQGDAGAVAGLADLGELSDVMEAAE